MAALRRQAVGRVQGTGALVKETVTDMLHPKAFGPKAWLADTGAGYDIVSAADIDPDWEEHTGNAIPLDTGNGLVTTDAACPMQILAMDADTPFLPLVLPKSPPVLSVGLRCVDEGYGFSLGSLFDISLLRLAEGALDYLRGGQLLPVRRRAGTGCCPSGGINWSGSGARGAGSRPGNWRTRGRRSRSGN